MMTTSDDHPISCCCVCNRCLPVAILIAIDDHVSPNRYRIVNRIYSGVRAICHDCLIGVGELSERYRESREIPPDQVGPNA